MSRPLTAKTDTKKRADQWHREVFAMFGPYCVMHRYTNPRCQVRALDAAHVLARSIIGTALAYVSPRLGRPLCRDCHNRQGLGLDPAYRFSFADRLDATRAHNEFAKSKIVEPTE